MCLGGPHRVMEMPSGGRVPVQDLDGKKKPVFTDLVPDVKTGEYVLVAHGYITARLDPAAAEQAIAALASHDLVLESALGDPVPLAGAPVPAPAAREPASALQARLAF